MKTVTVEGNVRTDLGKKATLILRREGGVPCVLYGGEENVHFSAPTKAFKKIVYTPDFNIINVEVDGKSHRAVMQDLQFHPVTDKLLHIDFMALTDGRPITASLPIVFEGLAEGVKAGGKLLPKERKLKVKALPENLISELKVDVTNLVLGKSVKVGDLSYENIEILNNPNIPIASVEIPRALKSAQADEEGEEATATLEEAAE